jgi:hypothetical protein
MPYRNYPPLLDSGRNPFELFVLGFSLVFCLPLLWGAAPPGSATALLGPVLVHVWAAFLVFGCTLALTGIWWTWWGWLRRWLHHWRPRAATGLLIEQVGLVAVGVGDVIYAIAVFAAPGSRGRIAGAIILGFGLACFWRAWHIQRWVRAIVEGP